MMGMRPAAVFEPVFQTKMKAASRMAVPIARRPLAHQEQADEADGRDDRAGDVLVRKDAAPQPRMFGLRPPAAMNCGARHEQHAEINKAPAPPPRRKSGRS